MFVQNMSENKFVMSEKTNSSDISTFLSDKRTKIAVIAIPVILVVLIAIACSVIIFWNIRRIKKRSLRDAAVAFSLKQRSELDLGQSAAKLEEQRLRFMDRARHFFGNTPEDFFKPVSFNKEVQTITIGISRRNHKMFSSDGECLSDCCSYSPPPYPLPPFATMRSHSIKRLGALKTKSDIQSIRVRGAKGSFSNRLSKRHLRQQRDSPGNSSTPYPSSLSTCRSVSRRYKKRRVIASLNVLSARNMADDSEILGSRCDCRACLGHSPNSSLVPNPGSWVLSESRERGESTSSLKDKDGIAEEQPRTTSEIAGEHLRSSSPFSQSPSTIKSAPPVICRSSTHIKNPDHNARKMPRDIRAFSNSNCFPFAWDYEPGGYRDYNIYKNKLTNLKRIQNYYDRPHFDRGRLQHLFEHRCSCGGMPAERGKMFQMVKFNCDNKKWIAIKDKLNSSVRVVPADWLLDYEHCSSCCSCCCSCDTSCTSSSEIDENATGNPAGRRKRSWPSRGLTSTDLVHHGTRTSKVELPLDKGNHAQSLVSRRSPEVGREELRRNDPVGKST